jgi:large-conductance mechanosensitive channel
VLIILVAGLICGLLHLSSPMLVDHLVDFGSFAVMLVALLWIAQWLFLRLPAIRSALASKTKTKEPTSQESSKAEPQQNNKKDKE